MTTILTILGARYFLRGDKMGMAPVLDAALAGSSFVLAPETISCGTCRHVLNVL